MKRLLLVCCLLWALPAEAARVCLEKSTGKLIEYQSNATPGTLTKNALAAGYAAKDIQEQEVTDSEWATLRQTWILQPAIDAQAAKEAARKQKADSLAAKLKLSPQEFEELREALR